MSFSSLALAVAASEKGSLSRGAENFYKLAVDFLFANNLSSAERFLLGGFLTIWTHRQTGRW